MRNKSFSVAAIVLFAIFVATLLLTATRAAAQEKVLHSFVNGYPVADLIFDSSGNLYGTTSHGGAYGYGTVFEMTHAGSGGWTGKALHSFGGGADGTIPYGSLVFDAAGNLYGTTLGGGAYQLGTAFELVHSPGGGWAEKMLHEFGNGNADGLEPRAGLIFDAAGNLYGTTEGGGAYGIGSVFELSPKPGGGWTEAVLYNFCPTLTCADGNTPTGSLILDTAGNLYGTTSGGGTLGKGTAFELTPSAGGIWTETVLHTFGDDGTDGANPEGAMIFDATGNLYGTTYGGGSTSCSYPPGCGTVFELTPVAGGIWTETILHSFDNNGADGYYPNASLIFDASGNIYGTTYQGGAYGFGTAFELMGGSRTETLLHSFQFNGIDGDNPVTGLISDAFGNFYGTTVYGGADNAGTVFAIKP